MPTPQHHIAPDLGTFFKTLTAWINLTPPGPFGPPFELNVVPFKAVFCPANLFDENCAYAYGFFLGVDSPSVISGTITMLADNLDWLPSSWDGKPFGTLPIITAGNVSLELRTVGIEEFLILSVAASSDTPALEVSLTSSFGTPDHLVASGHSNRSEMVSLVLNRAGLTGGVTGG